MNLERALKQLNQDSMTRLLSKLYGIYGDIDDMIERHIEIEAAAGSDDHSISISESLKRQLTHLANEGGFVDYRSSYGFSCRLQALLLDINTLLREQNIEQALQITEAFLQLTDSVFERVDDSDGNIGMVFRDAVDQWLDIAAELRSIEPGTHNWVDKILGFFDSNDYGCFDDIISHSRRLLTEEELRQLARRFENQARKALASEKDRGGYNYAASHACLGLRSVAEALNDLKLYEKSILITSPQPNTIQLAVIINFAFEIKELESARYWLQQPQWQEDKHRHTDLYAELLKLQGNMAELKQHLLNSFVQQPNERALKAYLEIADPQEQASIKGKVEALAPDSINAQQAISMLLIVDNSAQAAECVIHNADALAQVHYHTLLEWAEIFTANQLTLAAIVCYRALLTDLLDRGYSKAYHHGARYFHRLLALDKLLSDYQGLDDAQSFIKQIQQKHWRKRSFWAEADYPNKPE